MDFSNFLSNFYPSDVIGYGFMFLTLFCVFSVCMVSSAVESTKRKKVLNESKKGLSKDFTKEADDLLKDD